MKIQYYQALAAQEMVNAEGVVRDLLRNRELQSYVGLRPGMHVWIGMDWAVAHSAGALFMPVRRHISFGITQQFRLHR